MSIKAPYLYHFDPHEFVRNGINWMPLTEPRLLVLLDVLRGQWGHAVRISDNKHALGRRDDTQSWHNVNTHGLCYAADIVPSDIETESDAVAFTLLAKSLGFTGIGVYTDWASTKYGFHLDVRTDRRPDHPATWSRINGQYAAIDAALENVA